MNEVPETRESLLVRVKDPSDRDAWNEFVQIYRPAIYRLARARGLQLVAEGKVAAFVVAGGQGTRLGFDGPKGCLEATPVTRKSLFQVLAEQILAAGRRAGRPVRV